MPGFDINKVDNPQNTPQKPVTQEQGVTREQFINNIFGGADSSKAPELVNKAGSIFNQLDNSPKDGTLSQTEINNGAPMISILKDIISVAIGGAKNTQESAASVNQKVSPEASEGASKFEQLPPEQKAEAIKQEIDEIYASGASVVDFDKDVITVRGSDGQEFDISLSQLGLSKETIEQLKPVIEDCVAEKIVDASADNLKAANLNTVLDAYEQKGFYPEGTPVQNEDGDLIGTLRNDKGEEVKINLNTGKEVTDE